MKGKVCKWNDDKGFGFILSEEFSEKVFFHISDIKTIARRRYSRSRRHHRSGFGTQGIFKLLRIAALAAPAVAEAVSSASPQDKVMHALANYTGYDFMSGTVNPSWLIRGYGPFLLTSLATIGIPKLMGIIKKVV